MEKRLLCVILGLGLFLTTQCKKEEKFSLPANFDVSVERAEDIEILYSDSAKLKIRITGPVMLYHQGNKGPAQEFIDGVLVDFFDTQEQVTSQLSAKYGIRYERQGKVVVRDSVVWKSKKGESIESEELIWDERTKKIFTKKFARISRPDEIIYGYGFEADQNFTNAKINAVTGRVKVEKLQ